MNTSIPGDPKNEKKADEATGSAPADPPTSTATPPLIIWGERKEIIAHDEETGERAYVVPTGQPGVWTFVPFPAPDAPPYGAITDYLNFTFPLASRGIGEVVAILKTALNAFFFPMVERRGPTYFYDHSFRLGNTQTIFAHGGNNDTALLSIPGEACSLIHDWPRLIEVGRDVLKGHITRWDVAVDDYLGQHSVDMAAEMYDQGLFGTGGNMPIMGQKGNWRRPDGRGRSITIGERANGKRLQVYEKGMQLKAKWHPWTRWEVQLGNIGRIVPWEVLLEPGRYHVGAYPKALSWVQSDMCRIATLQKQASISYASLKRSAKQAYGKLFSVMLEVEGSAEKVVAELARPGVPARLDHPARPKIERGDD